MTTDKKTDASKLNHDTLEVMLLSAIGATDLALAYGVDRSSR